MHFKISGIRLTLITLFFAGVCQGQIIVGLDNWFNDETHAETGMPFHYLWTDTADSGYSRWGAIFKSKGAKIVTVYKPDLETLRNTHLYIIVDPDSVSETPTPNFMTNRDIANITEWVRVGGVLVLMANDGKNCALSDLNRLSSRFGMIFNNVTLHPVTNNNYEMGAFTGLPDHPVFKGIRKIFMKDVASIRLSGNATPVLTENGQTIIAESKYGNGFVFAVGDPWIYNEYIDHNRLPKDFENRRAAEKLTEYLLKKVEEASKSYQ